MAYQELHGRIKLKTSIIWPKAVNWFMQVCKNVKAVHAASGTVMLILHVPKFRSEYDLKSPALFDTVVRLNFVTEPGI
jgi:hypothetical protein